MKTSINLFLIITLTGITLVANAQKSDSSFFKKITLAPEIGPNLSSHSGEDRNSLARFVLGCVMNMPIAQNFSLEGSLRFAQKGSSSKDGDFKETVKMSYIDLPILVKHHTTKKFSLQAGVQPSFLLSAKNKFDSPNLSDEQKVTDDYKKFDLAAVVGMGYQINHRVGLKLLYHHGLVNISGSNSYGGFGSYGSLRNRSVSLTASVNLTSQTRRYDRHGNVIIEEKGMKYKFD